MKVQSVLPAIQPPCPRHPPVRCDLLDVVGECLAHSFDEVLLSQGCSLLEHLDFRAKVRSLPELLDIVWHQRLSGRKVGLRTCDTTALSLRSFRAQRLNLLWQRLTLFCSILGAGFERIGVADRV